MSTFKFLRLPFVVCVHRIVNDLVIDIILNITSQEHCSNYYISVRDYSNSAAKMYL